jgi:hypothetical protein
MEVEPVVVTSENFATAAMRAAMDDREQVKLFYLHRAGASQANYGGRTQDA